MALLDRNGVYGSARFHTSGKRNDIRAHVGAEIAVAGFGSRLTPPAWVPHQHPAEAARLPLLCASREGYQNLCQMITQFKMRETVKSEGAATREDLEQYAAGLICLTGGDEGPLAAALAQGGEEAGRRRVEELAAIFGRENVYVEAAAASGARRGMAQPGGAAHCALAAICRWWRPMACATPGVRPRNSGPLHGDPPSHRSIVPGGCWREQSAVSAQRARRWLRSSAMCRARWQTRWNCLRGSRSNWMIWVTNSRVIRCRRAKRWTAFCASEWQKACSGATARRRTPD